MVKFLHRPVRRILQRVSLPQEDDWDSLKSFYFVTKELLSKEQFMVKTNFKNRALNVVKGQIDIEKNKKKSGGSGGAAAIAIAQKYTPFIEACREFIRQLCFGLLSQNT